MQSKKASYKHLANYKETIAEKGEADMSMHKELIDSIVKPEIIKLHPILEQVQVYIAAGFFIFLFLIYVDYTRRKRLEHDKLYYAALKKMANLPIPPLDDDKRLFVKQD